MKSYRNMYKGYFIKLDLNTKLLTIDNGVDSCTVGFKYTPTITLKEIEEIAYKEIDKRIKYLDNDLDINSVCAFVNN